MATLIHIDGSIETVHPAAGEGKAFEGDEINRLIDAPRGYLQGIHIPPGRYSTDSLFMMVHEEGRLIGLPVNIVATRLMAHIIPPDDWISGKALVVTLTEGGNGPDSAEELELAEALAEAGPPCPGCGAYGDYHLQSCPVGGGQ